jgi:WD40 repeat protein
LARLLHDTREILPPLGSDPREIYRSILPFLPPSSPVRALYGNLSDTQVLRVRNRIDKLHVLSNPPRQSNKSIPIPPIACTALSDDGNRVALGFRDGVIQVVDAELGVSISQFADSPPSSPAWLLFINEGRIATENVDGDIYILDYVTSHRQQIGSRLGDAEKVITSLSHDGSMIVRVSQHSETSWYENMHIIRISAEIPVIDALASPSLDPPIPVPTGDKSEQLLPLRRSLGFSPDGQYVAAFDSQQAFVWSSTSSQVVARYSVEDPSIWFLNTNRMTPVELPDDLVITSIFEPSQPISSLSCVLFNLMWRPVADSLWVAYAEIHQT